MNLVHLYNIENKCEYTYYTFLLIENDLFNENQERDASVNIGSAVSVFKL